MGTEKVLEYLILFFAGGFGWILKGIMSSIKELESSKVKIETKLETYHDLATKKDLKVITDMLKEIREETRNCENFSINNKK